MLNANDRPIRRTALSVAFLAVACFTLAGCGKADPHAGHDHGEGEHVEGEAGDEAGHTDGKDGDNTALTAETLERMEPSADYAAKTCPISGEPLDSMGDPIAVRYEGREVQFCCESCLADFAADPAAALAKLDAEK